MKMNSVRLAAAALCFACMPGARAATPAEDGLRTNQGKIIPGKISSVHGPIVIVATARSQMIAMLDGLDEQSLGKVAEFLATKPAVRPKWEGSQSAVARSLNKKLLILQGDKLVPFNPGERPEPEFYLAYFSAHWCAPCRAFTPELVAGYASLQAKYPGVFELVFLSDDESSFDQVTYAREAKMPWPMVKFSAAEGIVPFEQWHGRGIPDLMVTNREGRVIFKSYEGEEYIGPREVLNRFSLFLTEIDPANPATKRSRYRLEAIAHVRSSAQAPVAVKPYMVSLNPRRYQTLQPREFTARLKIDAAGKVAEVVSTNPALDLVLDQQFQHDTAEWLFLPAAEQGQAKECTIDLPVRI